MLLRKLLDTITQRKLEEKSAELYRSFLRHEAKIGGQLFGEVSKNSRREFFCLDEHTWVWHEEWLDQNDQRQIKTIRYDIRPSGILKAQDGQHYQHVTVEEAQNLYEAAKAYRKKVREEIYSFI